MELKFLKCWPAGICLIVTFHLMSFIAEGGEPGPALKNTEQLQPVVFAIPSLNANFLPVVIAEEKGFYRSAGIQAQVQPVKTPVAITGAFTGDVGYVFAATSTIGAAIQGLALRVVSYINLGTFFLYAAPNIRSVADLKGKTIARASIAGLEYHSLQTILKANGVDPLRDVKYITLGDNSLGLAAVKSGQAHAAIANLPTPLAAEKEGLHIIANSADYTRFPTAAVGVSLDRIKSRPHEVKEVVRGTLLATRYIPEHLEESAQILARWHKLPPDVARRTLELLRPSWILNGFLDDREVQAVIDERKEALKVTRDVAPTDVVDYRFLKEIHRELGLAK